MTETKNPGMQAPLPRGSFEEQSKEAQTPNLIKELETAITNLAVAQNYETEARTGIEDLEGAIAATELGRELEVAKASLSDAQTDVAFLDDWARDVAVRIHDETGVTKPHKAVTIKKYNTPVVKDLDRLMHYVRIHVPQCIKLDTRQVTKLARGGLELPWVEFEEEYRATISRNLSSWLPDE